MESFPTPPGAACEERMSPGFLKLHPGPPVHVFTDAADEHFHNHNFDFLTHIVAGSYAEEVLTLDADGRPRVHTYHRQAGTSHHVTAGTIHRLTSLPDGFCVTRAEYGPTVQKPGFFEVRGDEVYHRFWDSGEWCRWPRA